MPEACIEIEMDDGAVDAFVASPASEGRRPPILLLSDRHGVTTEVESRARRLSAHNYFVLAPDLSGVSADDCHETVSACLDHLADAQFLVAEVLPHAPVHPLAGVGGRLQDDQTARLFAQGWKDDLLLSFLNGGLDRIEAVHHPGVVTCGPAGE